MERELDMVESDLIETKRNIYNKWLIFALIGLLLSLSCLFTLSVFSSSIIEKGPQLLFFLIFCFFAFLISFLVLIYIWIWKSLDEKWRKNYFYIILGIVLISILYLVWNGYVTKKEYRHVFVEGIERQYRVKIPNHCTTSQCPLLFALHGGMGNAKDFEKSSQFNVVSDDHNVIVVYPDGVGYFKYTMHVWNSGYIEEGIKRGSNDVLFIKTVILELKKNLNISKVFITGHSNGAMMTYRVAGECPEVFQGAAPVSGSIGGKATKTSNMYIIPSPSQPINIVHVHGFLDINLKYNGGYPSSGFQVGERYDMSVNESISFWIKENNCDPNSIDELSSDNNIKIQTFANGSNQTTVRLVTIYNQNHFWENMNSAVSVAHINGTKSLAHLIWHLLNV